MTEATPYTVPQEPGRWRALIAAALVHALLLAFLWVGVHWQSETPATIEAEVWSPQAREAAPRPEPIKEPEAKAEAKPISKEIPKVKAVDPSPVKPSPVKPDIALEQEKKRKALEEKEKKRLDEEKEHLAKLKRQEEEQERLAKLKQQAEEKERLAKLKQQAEAKRIENEKAENARKVALEKKRKQDEADAQLAAKVRDEEMRRITGVVGTGGMGDATKAQGGRADAGYAQRVAAKIKSNINFNVADDMPGNPPVEFVVNLLPDGSVAGIRKVKSSGIPGFDDAVRRAIEMSQPYPKDKSGSVPSSFIGIHKPKDQ